MAKYRTSFVTNSSSSSFICDVCGKNHSGWDITSSDVGGARCINGHEWCDCFRDFNTDQMKLKEELTEQIQSNIHDYRTKSYWIEDGSGERYAKEAEEQLKQIESGEVNLEELAKEWFEDGLPACQCPICSFQTYSAPDMCNYMYKLFGIDRGLVFAEIKKVNKRRRKLYDSEYIDYVCKAKGVTTDQLMDDIRSNFKTYDEFLESL